MDKTDVSKKNRPRFFSRDVNDVVRPINKKLNDEKLLDLKDVDIKEVKKDASNKHAIRKSH